MTTQVLTELRGGMWLVSDATEAFSPERLRGRRWRVRPE